MQMIAETEIDLREIDVHRSFKHLGSTPKWRMCVCSRVCAIVANGAKHIDCNEPKNLKRLKAKR